MVDQRYFSLNSSLFKAVAKGKPRQIPFVRPCAFGYKVEDGVASLAGRLKSHQVGFSGERKEILRIEFLKFNRRYVVASRRSLTRGLGCRVTRTELVRSGLLEREIHYLSLPKGAEKPLPVKRSRLQQDRIPVGWSLRTVREVTKEMRDESKKIGPEFVQCAWSHPELAEKEEESEWRERVYQTGFSWSSQIPSLKKRGKLLGLSPRNAYRYISTNRVRSDGRVRSVQRLPQSELDLICRENAHRVWLPDAFLTREQMVALPTESWQPRGPVFFTSSEGPYLPSIPVEEAHSSC